MTKFSFNQAVPFEATHVGEVIKDELSARNMKQSELSGLTGIQRPILNDVIKGKRSLTPEMALLFIGKSAQYFCSISHADSDTIRIRQCKTERKSCVADKNVGSMECSQRTNKHTVF